MSSKVSPQRASRQSPVKEKQSEVLFDKDNFKWMLIGLGIIFFGFYLMSGGGSEDPNVFNNELFSTQRIVIAPIIVVAGLVVEVYAILKKSREE
jgi:hypothetical protein